MDLLIAAVTLANAQDGGGSLFPKTEPPPESPPEAPEAEEAPLEVQHGLGGMSAYEREDGLLRALVAAGAGRAAERELGGSGIVAVRLGASFQAHHLIRIDASFDDQFYEQTYISVNPQLDGSGAQVAVVDEQMQDLQIGASTNLLALLDPLVALDRHMRLDLSLVPLRWTHLANPLFGTWTGSTRIGAEATLYPAESFYFDAGAGFGPRLFGRGENLSAMGRPKVLADYHAGLGLNFGTDPYWGLELGWKADSITFQHTHRMLHTARLGLVFAY